MRFKLTILLAILNIAIFCLILYVDKNQSSKDEFLAKSRMILDDSFVQGVQEIQINSPRTGEVWNLKRGEDASWQVTRPVHWKANPYAIQQLLFQLKALSWQQRFPIDSLAAAGQSLQSYDLQDPPLVLSLNTGTESISLTFGAPTEIGNRLYMLSPEGDYILVITRELATTLQQNLKEFLDRRLFNAGMEESRVIQIQDRSASNVRVRMERSGQDWRFVSPIEAAADSERVQALLAEWQTLEGTGFRLPTAGDQELEGEGLRLTLEGLNSRESVRFGMEAVTDGATDYYLAKMEGFETIFRAPAKQVDALRRIQEDLRERRILKRHAQDWTSMEIVFDELSTTLQRLENGAWQVLNKSASGELISQPADASVVRQIRELLETLEVVRFVSDAPSETDFARFGLNAPQRRIILRKADGKTVELSIGGLSREANESLLYGTTSEMASVFLIRPHVLGSIPLSPMHYRERTIRTIPEAAEITEIRLEQKATGKIRAITEASEPLAWVNIKAYLRSVQVQRFLNTRFSDPLKLDNESTLEWSYMLRAKVTYPEATTAGKNDQLLYLTERIGGTTQYVGDPETGLIGVLPPDLIEVLEPLMVEYPAAPDAPPAPENQVIQPGT